MVTAQTPKAISQVADAAMTEESSEVALSLKAKAFAESFNGFDRNSKLFRTKILDWSNDQELTWEDLKNILATKDSPYAIVRQAAVILLRFPARRSFVKFHLQQVRDIVLQHALPGGVEQNYRVRADSYWTLAEIDLGRSMPILIQGMEDRITLVRKTIVQFIRYRIEKFRGNEAIKVALMRAENDARPEISQIAAEARRMLDSAQVSTNAAMLGELRNGLYPTPQAVFNSQMNTRYGQRLLNGDETVIKEMVDYFHSFQSESDRHRMYFYQWLQNHQSKLSANVIVAIGLENYSPFFLQILSEISLSHNPDGNPRAAARQIIEMAEQGTIGGYPVREDFQTQAKKELASHPELRILAEWIKAPAYPVVAKGIKPGVLLLVRHGETSWNDTVLDKWAGWLGAEVTEKGKIDTLKAGQAMNKLRFDHVLSSDLPRAQQTMQYFLEGMGVDVTYESVSALREKTYGFLSGWRRTDVESTFGKSFFIFWRRAPVGRAPGGESFNDTRERVEDYLVREILPRIARGENVAISLHGNSARALIAALREHTHKKALTDEEIIELEVAQAAPIGITFDLNLKAQEFWTQKIGAPAVQEALLKASAAMVTVQTPAGSNPAMLAKNLPEMVKSFLLERTNPFEREQYIAFLEGFHHMQPAGGMLVFYEGPNQKAYETMLALAQFLKDKFDSNIEFRPTTEMRDFHRFEGEQEILRTYKAPYYKILFRIQVSGDTSTKNAYWTKLIEGLQEVPQLVADYLAAENAKKFAHALRSYYGDNTQTSFNEIVNSLHESVSTHREHSSETVISFPGSAEETAGLRAELTNLFRDILLIGRVGGSDHLFSDITSNKIYIRKASARFVGLQLLEFLGMVAKELGIENPHPVQIIHPSGRAERNHFGDMLGGLGQSLEDSLRRMEDLRDQDKTNVLIYENQKEFSLALFEHYGTQTAEAIKNIISSFQSNNQTPNLLSLVISLPGSAEETLNFRRQLEEILRQAMILRKGIDFTEYVTLSAKSEVIIRVENEVEYEKVRSGLIDILNETSKRFYSPEESFFRNSLMKLITNSASFRDGFQLKVGRIVKYSDLSGQITEVKIKSIERAVNLQDRTKIVYKITLLNGSKEVTLYTFDLEKPAELDNAQISDYGGIDLNARNMNMDVGGEKIDIHFDKATIEQFERRDFSGVRAVIIKITPIQNVMPLLGLKEEDERLAGV